MLRTKRQFDEEKKTLEDQSGSLRTKRQFDEEKKTFKDQPGSLRTKRQFDEEKKTFTDQSHSLRTKRQFDEEKKTLGAHHGSFLPISDDTYDPILAGSNGYVSIAKEIHSIDHRSSVILFA